MLEKTYPESSILVCLQNLLGDAEGKPKKPMDFPKSCGRIGSFQCWNPCNEYGHVMASLQWRGRKLLLSHTKELHLFWQKFCASNPLDKNNMTIHWLEVENKKTIGSRKWNAGFLEAFSWRELIYGNLEHPYWWKLGRGRSRGIQDISIVAQSAANRFSEGGHVLGLALYLEICWQRDSLLRAGKELVWWLRKNLKLNWLTIVGWQNTI